MTNSFLMHTPARAAVSSLWLGMLAALTLAACADCRDNDEEANAFLQAPENRICQEDADCVVVRTGCAMLSSTRCDGSALLSAEAAASERWRDLEQSLEDCHESSCVICDIGPLQPKCSEGLCER